MHKSEQSPRKWWDTIKRADIYIMGVAEGEE